LCDLLVQATFGLPTYLSFATSPPHYALQVRKHVSAEALHSQSY
jgi:hypothetical protein